MNKKTILGALLLSTCLGMSAAQKPIKAPTGGKAISDHLIGIFFEDISSATDGGLNANLVQNGSFEYSPSMRDGWGPGTCWKFIRPGHSAGFIEPRMDNTIHPNNKTYMRINAERIGHYYDFAGWNGVGMENEGYNGMNIKAGAKYDFSVFLRGYKNAKTVRVVLISADKGWGQEGGQILAEDTISIDKSGWNKYESTLTAAADCKDATLKILLLDEGSVDVDMVMLIPQDTYHGHGIRKDLAEALEGLNPKFMRFPGGCVVHGGGDGFWNTYRWKTTVGPKETRRALKNTWNYGQSMEVGYYEYFQLCEDMNIAPLPILPCGVSCQGVNGGWNMWPTQAQKVVPMSEMDEWVQDALDLIEWANGDVNTKWGKVRADAGHPKPFGLKYLGIGNEEKISPEFCERFKYMYEKITAAHPEIIIVGTAGPGSHKDNPDYEAGWKLADETGLPIIDEHYYDPRQMFIDNRQYDNYDRSRKTKVYLGEYSVQDKDHGQMNQWGDALAEAIYLMHVERNADVVEMTSYAPLFAYKHNTNWNPDMIYFDNERPYFTCSYYVQQMFGQSAGQYFYGDCVKFDRGEDEFKNHLLAQSVILNVKTHELFVKVANMTDETRTASLDLKRFGIKSTADKTVLKGNLDDENNYDNHPVSPVKSTVKVKKQMPLELPAHSVTMLKIKL